MEHSGMEAGQYLTLKEAAQRSHTPYATLRRDIDHGKISAYRVGRKYLLSLEVVDAYAAQRKKVAAMSGYTIREVMDILPLSYAYLIELIRSGRLQAVKQGRRYIITEEALQRFLAEAKL